ncbi:MAG TPA: four helix bundle protein [Candidatus Saccharimonadales bacterium]|nr:four helix bundle protein [Candidatus Saccharimonadales bacterium]
MSQESRVKSQEKKTIKSFTDLIAWQKAHAFAVAVYKNTVNFPPGEQFGLTNQIRRASVSVPSNIAEGFGRRTVPDRTHFYDMARASLAEVQSQLLLSRDVGYLLKQVFEVLAEQSVDVHKLLTGLINATRKRSS